MYVLEVTIPIAFLLISACSGIFGFRTYPGIAGWVACLPSFSPSWNLGFSYYLIWLTAMGYIIGASANRLGYYAFLIDNYCKDFILNAKSRLQFHSLTGIKGSKPIGKLALTFNLAVSIPPTLSFAVILVENQGKTFSGKPYIASFLSSPLHMLAVAMYCLALAFLFFFPIRHLHKIMKIIKEEALQEIDNRLDATPSLGPDVGALLFLQERTKKSPTWPFDASGLVRIAASALFPFIGGAIVQTAPERILFG